LASRALPEDEAEDYVATVTIDGDVPLAVIEAVEAAIAKAKP